mgnify:CR=1 FL=1
MSVKITKNIKKANLVTHSSTFHPDDVFSTMFLSKIIKDPVVVRTNDASQANPDAIVYDIGFGKYDHHGPDSPKRKNNIKYCSFGLLWADYGRDYLKTINPIDVDKLWASIDEKLVMQIDAIDNGLFPTIEAPFHLSDLDQIIDLFNVAWNEEKDNDEQFIQAVEIAKLIFNRLVYKENASLVAEEKVEKYIDKVKDNILYVEEYMPYEKAMWHSKNPKAKEIKVVILPSQRGGYNIKPRTISEDSKELAYNFSKEFLGLHDEELVNVSKIKTAKFVHSSGFLACSKNLEDAYLLAKNAINNKE